MELFFILLASSIINLIVVDSYSAQFNLGGLFYKATESASASVFRATVRDISQNRDDGITFQPIVVDLQKSDSYITQHDVCELMADRVIGVFGPHVGDSSPIVQSVCDAKEVPNMQTRYEAKQVNGPCLLNLYPHPSALSAAYSDLVRAAKWSSFTIVYEDNESLMRISELLKPENVGGAIVTINQLSDDNQHRDMFRKIKSRLETNILIDCSTEKLPQVLNQAQQVGLITSDYRFIITCLDLHTIDLEQYKHSGASITGIRLVNPASEKIEQVVQLWTPYWNITADTIRVEEALMYDALQLFTSAVAHLFKGGSPSSTEKLSSCESADAWEHGFSLINQMRTMEMEGLTGIVKFDHEGFRTDIELQVIQVAEGDVVEIGIWNATTGVQFKDVRKNDDSQPEIYDLRNMTLTIIISKTPPYGKIKTSTAILTGNDRYEGYGPDLIYELSRKSGFNYRFIVEPNSDNGQIICAACTNGTGKWSGMMGAVIEGRAHLAVADLTITREREMDVDFSQPFMNLGIAILYKKPKNEPPNKYSFLFPFSSEVWLLVITAYIGVSLLFFIMARLSPYEWQNPYPCITEPEELENQFTLSNSFWFTIGALMQQGSDIAPIATSTRMAAGIWWFFTMIMVASYTANLAAFLTVENPTSPFNNIRELANHATIKYGAKNKGTTEKFFMMSTDPEYQRIWHTMNAHREEVMVGDNAFGVEKAVKEEYAFLMESTSIEYEVERHCELAQIGDLLDNKDYGIAMKKGAWYLGTITRNILELQEQGVLSTLKRKWWKEKSTGNCKEDEGGEAKTLGLGNVGGVFSVLGFGVIIATFIMFYEFFTNLTSTAREKNVKTKEELIKELKFILQCKSVKPVEKVNNLDSKDDEYVTTNGKNINNND